MFSDLAHDRQGVFVSSMQKDSTLKSFALAIATSLALIGSMPLSALADGGADTGGGNTVGAHASDPLQIKSFVEKSREPLKYFFRGIEFWWSLDNTDKTDEYWLRNKTLAKKLFANQETIYDKLKKAQFEFKGEQPCHDHDGKEVEASATPPYSICISNGKIAKRLNEDTEQSEVLALVAHEMTHLIVGQNEDEPMMVQYSIKAGSGKYSIDKYKDRVDDVRKNISDIRDSLVMLKNILNSASQVTICSAVTSISTTINKASAEELSNTLRDSRLTAATLSLRSNNDLYDAMAIGLNLAPPCFPEFAPYQKITAAFAGHDKILLDDWWQAVLVNQETKKSSLQLDRHSKRYVHLQTAGDKQALLLDLQQLEDIMNAILADI